MPGPEEAKKDPRAGAGHRAVAVEEYCAARDPGLMQGLMMCLLESSANQSLAEPAEDTELGLGSAAGP